MYKLEGLITRSPREDFKNLCPLRFIERDGKKILQSPWLCINTGKVEWKDVPLEAEEK